LQQPAKRNGPAIAVVLIISLLLGGIGLYFYSQYAARTAADHAIDAAVSACGGSSQVLAEKVVEAESAIRGLPSEEWGTYQTKLHNRMKFILCE
jgi:hypothetical protein